MLNDPVIEDLRRTRAEFFQEFGEDPEAFVKYLVEQEKLDAERWQVLTREAPVRAFEGASDRVLPRRVCRR